MAKVYTKEQGMTTVAAMICEDGLVMGSDTKVEGAGIKWSGNKIEKAKLGKSPLVIGGAGSLRHIRDSVGWMRLNKLGEQLGKDLTFDNFLSSVVERAMPEFAQDLYLKYGKPPDLELLIGCIDEDNKPRLVQVYPDGEYDYIEGCSVIGSGSVFGEILLRKLYRAEITIELAKRLIGYIIWEIQEVDDGSGEDMEIVCISKDRKLLEIPRIEIEAYKQLPKVILKSYEALEREIQSIDIESIKRAIETLNGILGKPVTT